MFFRDELLSWSWRRPLGIPSVPVAAGMINPLDFQQKVINNVEHVITRIKLISPHYLADEVNYFFKLDFCFSGYIIFSDFSHAYFPSWPLTFKMIMLSLLILSLLSYCYLERPLMHKVKYSASRGVSLACS